MFTLICLSSKRLLSYFVFSVKLLYKGGIAKLTCLRETRIAKTSTELWALLKAAVLIDVDVDMHMQLTRPKPQTLKLINPKP